MTSPNSSQAALAAILPVRISRAWNVRISAGPTEHPLVNTLPTVNCPVTSRDSPIWRSGRTKAVVWAREVETAAISEVPINRARRILRLIDPLLSLVVMKYATPVVQHCKLRKVSQRLPPQIGRAHV